MSVVLIGRREVVDCIMDHICRIDCISEPRRDGTSVRSLCEQFEKQHLSYHTSMQYVQAKQYAPKVNVIWKAP